MRELTDDLPKPMIPVRGKPILQHIIEGLRGAGVTDVLLIVGYREDVVRDFFGDGEKFGVRVSYERQVVQDGTGRVVELAKGFTRRRLVPPQLRRHSPRSAQLRGARRAGRREAIISVKHSEDVSKGGAVFVDEAFNMVDLREKPKSGEPTSPWYNAGVYLFRPSIYDFTRAARKVASRRIRAHRRDSRARAEWPPRACVRAAGQLGRRARPRGARGAERGVAEDFRLARASGRCVNGDAPPNMKTPGTKTAAFTVVEMLVVLAILAVLVWMAIPMLSDRGSSRVSALSNARQLHMSRSRCRWTISTRERAFSGRLES